MPRPVRGTNTTCAGAATRRRAGCTSAGGSRRTSCRPNHVSMAASRLVRIAVAIGRCASASDPRGGCSAGEAMMKLSDFACEVCGAIPDKYGNREHGRGCYTQSEDGGGSDWIELPREVTLSIRMAEFIKRHPDAPDGLRDVAIKLLEGG